MKFNEAKELIKKVLTDEANAFDIKELTVTTAITYQNEKGDECEENDKSIRFMSGEIFIKHDSLPDDKILGFSIVVECKLGGKVNDQSLDSEITEFKDQLTRLRTELRQSKSIPEFIYALCIIAEAENNELTKKLNEQVAQIDKNVKIMTYSALAIAVVGILVVVLVNLLRI